MIDQPTFIWFTNYALLFKDDYEKCIPYAVSLEMIHNFSLIHDDLPEIDNDDFRHGILTNHKKFDHATALLAGDMLFNQGYITISEDLKNENDPEELKNKIRVFNEFSKAVDRMIAGEYLDTELENKKIEKELLKYIHENKTGALLKLSVRMGAILAGADSPKVSIVTYSPSRPTYLPHESEEPASIATLALTFLGRTLFLYSSDCLSKISIQGIEITLASIPSGAKSFCASIASKTSEPLAISNTSGFSFLDGEIT